MSKKLAKTHAMDLPHVTAVEFPLIIQNEAKAIDMIGGKEKLAKVINNATNDSSNVGGTSNSSNANSDSVLEENMLELRLRNDPFHHPLPSLLTNKEKILLKVSIPKKSLPKEYYENPNDYTVQQLIEDGVVNYKVAPVAIINKTFLFKTMNDFQISTKNNPIIQEFNKLNNTKNYNELQEFFTKHDKLTDLNDFFDTNSTDNIDHNLPPPPIFSNIRLPFDFRYQKNRYTTVLKDEHGETKVVAKKKSTKLYSQIIEFSPVKDVPQGPAPELVEEYESLLQIELDLKENNNTRVLHSKEYNLLQCIGYLKKLFEVKPIWLRKHIDDLIPSEYKYSIKRALPFISYIYKSGPWRFCNILYGVDPRTDKSFWKYQCEYFRLQGIKADLFKKVRVQKILPKTIKEKSPQCQFKINDSLLFTGTKLPSTVAFQIGDLIDEDINDLISNTSEDAFFRDELDFNDGWLNYQSIQTIRSIIRYKLNRLAKDETIDPIKISKIVNTDYNDNTNNEQEEDNKEMSEELDDLELEEIDEEIDENIEESVLDRIEKLETTSTSKLKELVGFIKQDSL